MGSPSISGSLPLAFYIATARDDVREQARFISRRGRHSYVRSSKTLLFLDACGHQELIARKRNPTHTFETPDGYRRFRPLPAPTFELATCIRYDSPSSPRGCGASSSDQGLPDEVATTCWMCGTLQS